MNLIHFILNMVIPSPPPWIVDAAVAAAAAAVPRGSPEGPTCPPWTLWRTNLLSRIQKFDWIWENKVKTNHQARWRKQRQRKSLLWFFLLLLSTQFALVYQQTDNYFAHISVSQTDTRFFICCGRFLFPPPYCSFCYDYSSFPKQGRQKAAANTKNLVSWCLTAAARFQAFSLGGKAGWKGRETYIFPLKIIKGKDKIVINIHCFTCTLLRHAIIISLAPQKEYYFIKMWQPNLATNRGPPKKEKGGRVLSLALLRSSLSLTRPSV